MSKETTYRWLCASALTTEQYEAAEKKYKSRKGRITTISGFNVSIGGHPLSCLGEFEAMFSDSTQRMAEVMAQEMENLLLYGEGIPQTTNRQGRATSAELISGVALGGRMAELLRPRPFATDEISMEEYRRRYMQHIDATFSVASDTAMALGLAFSSLSRAAAPQAIVMDSVPQAHVSMDGGITFQEFHATPKQEEPVDTNPKTMYSKTPPPWAADWRNKRNPMKKGKRK